MRVDYLKLKYFKGIQKGMGLFEFELDLTKTDKRTILFVGGNGKGKSTIMSMLHPFAECFDVTRDGALIMDGKEGLKEIHIRKGDDLYRIEHHYKPGKNKSFMWKNDEPLNGNGGQRTFVTLCETELGVTPDHFKLIKVGSGSDNFIDLNSSARKQFMGKFTPSIQEYLEPYKIVNDKYNTSNKEIKYITDEMSKLDTKEVVETEIGIISKTLKKNTSAANAIAVELLSVEEESKKLEEGLSAFAEDLESRETMIAERAKAEAGLEEIYTQYPSRRGITSDDLQGKVEKLSSNLKVSRKTLAEKTLSKEKIQANKSNAMRNRNASDADERKYSKPLDSNTPALMQMIVKETEILNANVRKFDTIEDFSEDQIASLDIEVASASVSQLSRMANRIIEAKAELSGDDASAEQTEAFLFDLSEYDLDSKIEAHGELLETAEANAKSMRILIRNLENDIVASTAVRNIVGMCSTKTCGVYKIGVSELQKDSELSKADKALNELNDLTVEMKTQRDLMASCRAQQSLFTTLVHGALKKHAICTTKPDLAELLEVGSSKDIGRMIWLTAAADIEQLFDFSMLITKINLYKKINDSKKTIVTLKEKIKSFENAEQLLTDLRNKSMGFTAEVTKMEAEEQALLADIDALEADIDTKEQTIELYRSIIDAFAAISQIDKELKVLNKIYDRNKASIETLKRNEEKLKGIAERKEDADLLVTEITDSLNKQRLKLERISEYNERKEALAATRDQLRVIKDALDIKTGMPLYVLGAYLDEIKETTNDLLSIAFKNSFAIDFQISDSDFSIPVYQDGVLYNKDVLSCSQGETALVKCSLSLGISSQAIKRSDNKYNIVYLDEIDSELDTSNRQRFIEILERQLDALSCEQCFIITHNDAFSSAEVGLILLEGANIDTEDEVFMFNKEVVFNIKDNAK